MTQSPQVPRSRSSVSNALPSAGDKPWLAVPAFFDAMGSQPEVQQAAESAIEPNHGESRQTVATAPASGQPEVGGLLDASTIGCDSRIDSVAEVPTRSILGPELISASGLLPAGGSSARFRRWLPWASGDWRRTVTVLGGVALGVLAVLRSASPGPENPGVSGVDATQLSREVHAIERLTKTPLRLAASETENTVSKLASGGRGDSDPLFEVKRLQAENATACEGDGASESTAEQDARQFAATHATDKTENRQASDLRPATEAKDYPAEAVSAADVLGRSDVPGEESLTNEKDISQRPLSEQNAYPSTDPSRYPAYRVGSSRPASTEQRR